MKNDKACRVADRLQQLLGDRASRSASVLEHHGQSEAYHPLTPPDIVVYPETTEEVRQVVAACAEAECPVVPFGAGSSLEGNALAVSGGVCIDMGRMNRLLEVNASDLDCRVQPGITRKQLNEQLRGDGVFFPIDPGADASIGGMASTRASGTMAVRYGTMRDNVLSLEVVTAEGRVIRTSSRSRKSAAGYDLTRLFVGSEGTLGVITELVLKVQPLPEAISAAVCGFDTIEGAVETSIELMQAGVGAARIELLDATMIAGLNLHFRMGLPEIPTLFLEFQGGPAAVAEQAETAQTIARDNGAHGFEWATRPEDRSRLWHARDNTLYAGRALRPGSRALITDVAVPISRLGECIVRTQADIASLGLVAPLVGHVGDGNFHLLVLVDPASADDLARARQLHARMVERAIAMGGTCTGEHGIGIGKIDYLERELGEAVDVMRSIKRALDPRNIMNPGKIFRLT